MSIGSFDNPITGAGGSLVVNQLKSPNYVPGSTGWVWKKDGSMEANNGTFRGTITGSTITAIEIVTGGSWAGTYDVNLSEITDPHIGANAASLSFKNTNANAFLDPYFAGFEGTGGNMASLFSGKATSGDIDAGVIALAASANGGNASTVIVNGSYIQANGPIYAELPGGSTQEVWHNVSLSGITIPNGGGTPTGTLRYKLLPTKEVVVHCTLAFTATTAQGSVNLITLGTGYIPVVSSNWPVRVYTATAPVNNELTGGVTTAGVVFVNNIPTGANTVAFYQHFPLD